MPDWINAEFFATTLFLIVIFQFKRILTLVNLFKITLQPSGWQIVTTDSLPNYLQDIFAEAQQNLENLGFKKIETRLSKSLIINLKDDLFSEIYWHEQHAVMARVEKGTIYTGSASKISFISLLSHQQCLVTVNRDLINHLPQPSSTIMVDVYADNLLQQWQAHLQKMTELSKQVVIDFEDVLKYEQQSTLNLLSHLVSINWVKKLPDNLYRFTLKGAWQYSKQLVNIPLAQRQAFAKSYQVVGAIRPESLYLLEIDNIATQKMLAAQPMPAWLKLSLFVITLVISALLFGYDLGVISAIALITVLFVHELGHVLAMKLCRYKNLSILFLPFLGAVATGHKVKIEPWQEAAVLLAGPTFGLLVALLCCFIPEQFLASITIDFVKSFILFSVILNVFNLLPIGILDGGRVVELAIFGRFPFARAIFTLLGVIIGSLYALWSQSLLFGLLMFFLMFNIPLHFKVANLIKSLQKQSTNNEKIVESKIANQLAQFFVNKKDNNPYDIVQRQQRINIINLAYPRLIQGKPSIKTSLAILTAYIAILVLTIVMIVYSFRHPLPIMQIKSEQTYTEKHQQINQDFLNEYKHAKNAEEKWQVLDLHQYDLFDVSDVKINQLREDLLVQLSNQHLGKWQYLFDRNPDDINTIALIFQHMIGDEPENVLKLDNNQLMFLAQVANYLTQNFSMGQIQSYYSKLEVITELTKAHKDINMSAEFANALAHLYFGLGNIERAEFWMNHYKQLNTQQAVETYAWFLLDIKQPKRVLELTQQQLNKQDADENVTLAINRQMSWHTLQGWSELLLGHGQQADQSFQKVLDYYQQKTNMQQRENPWWTRLILWLIQDDKQTAVPVFLYRQTLDHLVALDVYQPSEIASKLALMQSEYMLSPLVNGWGKIRQEKHQQLIKKYSLTKR